MKKQKSIEEQLVSAALKMAEKRGYFRLEFCALAKAVGCSPALMYHYLGNVADARATVLEEAIRTENLRVIQQAIALRDPLVAGMPADLRARALAALVAEGQA